MLAFFFFFRFSFMNSFGDIEDLEQVLGKKKISKIKGSGSCSALVKLFNKNEDLAISQVTWNDYNTMLRIFKFYNLSFHMNSDKGLIVFLGFFVFVFLSFSLSIFLLSNVTWNKFLFIALKYIPLVFMFLHELSRQLLVLQLSIKTLEQGVKYVQS